MNTRSPYLAHLDLKAAARKHVEAVPLAPIPPPSGALRIATLLACFVWGVVIVEAWRAFA
jgi:hypothetical protein